MDGKWNGYQDIVLTAPMTVKAPRMLRILDHWTMLGKMTLDEEKNEIRVSYHIEVNAADGNTRNYYITATRDWSLSGEFRDKWHVYAQADSSRRMPHHEDFDDRIPLEENLEKASKWIEEHIREFALGSLTYSDHNYE